MFIFFFTNAGYYFCKFIFFFVGTQRYTSTNIFFLSVGLIFYVITILLEIIVIFLVVGSTKGIDLF